jgi:hypothetical protein
LAVAATIAVSISSQENWIRPRKARGQSAYGRHTYQNPGWRHSAFALDAAPFLLQNRRQQFPQFDRVNLIARIFCVEYPRKQVTTNVRSG